MNSLRDIRELSRGWRVTRHAPDDPVARWIPVKSVPTVIHLDLMTLPEGHPEKIADPFLDLNELDVRWVADVRWTYECRFRSPEYIAKMAVQKLEYDAAQHMEQKLEKPRTEMPKDNSDEAKAERILLKEWKSSEQTLRTTDLVFKGLDTLTTVTLNGIQILKTDNMFTEYVVDVTDQLLVDRQTDNVLSIQFESARQAGLHQVSNGPRHEYHVHQTEVGRAAVRKAQYHWGWDWGPILTTAGPWQPVLLDSHNCCIDKVRIWTSLSNNLTEGKVTVNVSISGRMAAAQLSAAIRTPSGQRMAHVVKLVDKDRPKGENSLNFDFKVPNPDLWWPAGYGRQDMYVVDLQLRQVDGDLADQASKRFGFRRAQLVKQPDKLGTSFYFEINNVDIFAGGSCWIPADSFLRSTNYRRWMELLVDSHQIMVRVWGGGIYESDYFYDACDELGLLVWQDFAFACASYPAGDGQFLMSVEVEARQNVARLQRHPSLVVWAGNNEDYQIKEHYDLQYDPTSMRPRSWLKTKFPARYIYEYMLPDIVEEGYGVHMGGAAVPYQPGSPYGDTKSTTLKVDPSIGDIHQWNVWHGTMRHYQEYPFLSGRFVSEFGMQAYPHVDTLYRTISSEDNDAKNDQLWPGSATMDVRNKAIGHQFRLLKYVAENFRIRELDDLVSFAHLTQIMQADAVSHAYKGWRRRWRKRMCGGALIWQFDDCWPTISWSVVDYYQVPKPAYYAIKRAMAPLAIAAQRKFHDWTTRRAGNGWQRDTAHVEPSLSSLVQYSVWVASSKLDEVKGCRTVVRFISIVTGTDVTPQIEVHHDIQPNTTTPILTDCFVLSEEQQAEGSSARNNSDGHRRERRSESTSTDSSGSQKANIGGTRVDVGSSSESEDSAAPRGRNEGGHNRVGWSTGLLQSLNPCVIFASLYVDDDLISSDASWPDPIKYLEFRDRQVKVNTHEMRPEKRTGIVTITAGKPVKGFVFAEKGGGVQFSDNGFDVMPGEIHLVVLNRSSAGSPWPLLEYTYVGQDIWG